MAACMDRLHVHTPYMSLSATGAYPDPGGPPWNVRALGGGSLLSLPEVVVFAQTGCIFTLPALISLYYTVRDIIGLKVRLSAL